MCICLFFRLIKKSNELSEKQNKEEDGRKTNQIPIPIPPNGSLFFKITLWLVAQNSKKSQFPFSSQKHQMLSNFTTSYPS